LSSQWQEGWCRQMIVIKNAQLRRFLKILLPFLAIPLLVLLGESVIGEKYHMFISLGVAVLALVLFLAGFEKKKIGTRRMVIVAVMTALCIVGRFIPFFQPIAALTVITAIYLGSESGFLVGSLSAVLSNFYFGQGPWTPFQMLAWGIIGLIAGYLAEYLKKSKPLLLTYGVLSGVLFSFIMDIWSVLWYYGAFDLNLYLASLVTAAPYTLSYAASNFIFLWFLAKPFGEKLERVRIKYGL